MMMLKNIVRCLGIILFSAVVAQADMSDFEDFSNNFLPYDQLHQIMVMGDINVILGGDSDPSVIQYDPKQVDAQLIEGGVLKLNAKQYSNFRSATGGMPTVVIRSDNRFKYLFRVIIRDQASLVAKDIESTALSVDLKTTGNVLIEGVMNLNSLKVDSYGEVEIYWVDSNSLDVNVQRGRVTLGGRADHLAMKASEDSEINASGLLSKHTWIAAVDASKVEAFPINSLFVYSKDSAVVDVKNKPSTYAALNQDPSLIVLNYIEMERRAKSSR